jgi:DNA-binding CsgD family transcriptional regulator
MQPKTFFYKDFLKLMANASTLKMHEVSNSIIERYQSAEYNMKGDGVVFLLDYTTRKYIYVSEACFDIFGYPVKEFVQGDLDWYLSNWHPLDLEIIDRYVFPDNLKFLHNLEFTEYANFIFSYNYRIKNSKGDYITLLQRFSYIPSNAMSKPFGVVGVGFDITHFKNDIGIVQTIEKITTYNGQLINNLVFKKIHPVYDYDLSQCLSRREVEVMEYISKGHSSKQIAGKMRISINTVHNHRRSMLLKVNCKSSSELMNYAAKHGLL